MKKIVMIWWFRTSSFEEANYCTSASRWKSLTLSKCHFSNVVFFWLNPWAYEVEYCCSTKVTYIYMPGMEIDFFYFISKVHNWLIPGSSFLCHLGAHKRYWIETSFEYVVSSLTNVETIGFTMIAGKTQKCDVGYTYMSMISKTFFLCRCSHLYCLLGKINVVWNKVMFPYFFRWRKCSTEEVSAKEVSISCLIVYLFFFYLFICYCFCMFFVCFFLECFDFLTTHYCQMIKPAGSYWIIQGKVSSA